MTGLKADGSYPQDMGYRTVFHWERGEEGVLPIVAIDIMLAMLKARFGNVSLPQLHGMHNKTFCIVGRGSRYAEELLAIYRHDDYWKVIAFSYSDWLRTYGEHRHLDLDGLPEYVA